MFEPRAHFVQCLSPTGLHSLFYKEWGDPSNPRVLMCVHGLTRTADDFDNLARAMSGEYRVVCPDVVGRGRSGWLHDKNNYQIAQYVSDMVTLIARINPPTLHYFGTSMGGLIGLGLASLPDSPIRRLVLNDVGPTINPEFLARIGEYLGLAVRYPDLDTAIAAIRQLSATFGAHTEEEWRVFAMAVLKDNGDGSWGRNYDLGLAQPFKAITPAIAAAGEKMAWMAYDAIRCPTLLVRGAESDLLSHEVALAMTERGPKARLVEISGVGHAPTFIHADQIQLARDFLLDESSVG